MTRATRIAFLSTCLVFAMIAACAQGQSVKFTGKVLDVSGNPVAGAKVGLYEIPALASVHTNSVHLLNQATTETDGVFLFEGAKSDRYREFSVVASKNGLASSWARWSMRESAQCDIVLTEPGQLGGVVADQDGKPVVGATVFIAGGILPEKAEELHYILGSLSRKLHTTRTDADGRFTIGGLAANATFELGAARDGYATINTFDRQRSSERHQYSPGQNDIRLVMPVEATIKGRVVEDGDNKPVAGLTVMAKGPANVGYFQPPEHAISEDDGTFVINSLGPETYTVSLTPPQERLADWVASPTTLTLGPGQTSEEVKLTVTKGALLEIHVIEEKTGRSIEKAGISVRDERTGEWSTAVSDAAGLATIRVLPGRHVISGPHRQGYVRGGNEETVTVFKGTPRRIELTLKEAPVISGIVHDPEGKVVEGARISVMPGGTRNVSSDSQGRFDILWDRSFWGDEEDTVFCLVARHEQRNLVSAVELGESTKTLDLQLEPGVVLSGRVVDPDGKPIAGATLRVMLHVSNWGSSLQREAITIGEDGSFAVKAVPAQRNYDLTANAQGYGSKRMKLDAEKVVGDSVDIGALTLPVANLSVSGCVVDNKGEPVADSRIESTDWDGGQPDRCTTHSDADGRFSLDGVCEGKISIRVETGSIERRLSARVVTHGGASGIRIIAREGDPVLQYISGKTYEQKMTAEKLIAGMAVDEAGSPVVGVPVGVCCIKKEREPGKYSWTYSSYTNLRDITDEQGRFAIEYEEGLQFNLLFSPDNHAAVIAYDIPAGTKDLKVTLPEGGTVNGRLVQVVKGEKVPIPNAKIKIEQTDRTSYTHLGFDRDRTTVTDSQGRFQFKHISRKIRPISTRTSQQWEYAPRVWKISCGKTAKNVVFYDNTAIDDFELLLEPEPGQTQIEVGAPLPQFDCIKIDLAADQTKDKAILLCFFDMQQRPSRNCVTQLAARAETLKEKGVAVALIQTSKTERNALAEWAKSQNVPFPVGVIEGDEKTTLLAWGVQSLPWLILTDKDHIVKAHGFNLSDLDENLTKVLTTGGQ